MPHLSPMNWILMLLMTSMIMLTMASATWWKQQQKITIKATTLNTPMSKQNWKW